MDPESMRFTWRIENFSTLNAKKKYYSEVFTVGGYNWRILIFPKGDNVDHGHLSVFLAVYDRAKLPNGWSRPAKFSFTVVNQTNKENSEKKELTQKHEFNAIESNWGFPEFMPLSELNDPSRGYLVNDTLIIEAKVVVLNPESVHSQVIELEKDHGRSVLNQDDVDDKNVVHCFDKIAKTLLEKLEDDKAHNSVKISDFKEIASDMYVDVGIFNVPASLECYAKELLARHDDIGNGNSPFHYVNEMVFVVLCAALKSMDTTSFSEMNESSILKWRDAIRGALQFGFKVEFLKDQLKSITEAYLAKSARNSDASKELQAIDDKIGAMEKELDTLKAHRLEMYNKVNTELRRTCEATSDKFPSLRGRSFLISLLITLVVIFPLLISLYLAFILPLN